ncbi:hypothetical protein EYF80_056935 [Liparis tanakae]|uniref:SEA domain-containing protein n=1 Tax=Liparis tanakae TaxID=230148 RepID=A0A4Z2EXC3_9TELE|nr:hypothetical protein EYF80_056935 [Liparis tanakae]
MTNCFCTAATTTAPAATTAATTAAPAATTAASTNPPTSSEGTLGLKFSLNQTFTSDLSNSSSVAYKTLAAIVTKELNTLGSRLYGSSYLRSIINGFTSGSVVVTSTLVFKDKSSVPSAADATSQFASALGSSSLSVVPGSVSAQSTSSSSSPPAPTVGSLAVVSLTLLAVAQMLINV